MYRRTPLLIVLALVSLVPASAEAQNPCEGVEPGGDCTVDMECDEPYEVDDGWEVECRMADGETITCSAYPQPHIGKDAWLHGCPGTSSEDPVTPFTANMWWGGGALALALGGVGLAAFVVVRRRIPDHAALVPFAPLFSRVGRSKALDQPRRRLVFEQIEAEPGIRLVDLGRRLGLANGELRHHVRILRQNGLVVETRSGGRVTLRVAGTPPVEPLAPQAEELLAYLRSSADPSIASACAALGWSRAKARHWSRRLVAAGMVEARREGRTARLAVAQPSQA